MSRTLLRKGYYYITDKEFERLERLRGYIPRSQMGMLAVQRFLDDVENGKLELWPKVKEITTPTIGDRKKNEKR